MTARVFSIRQGVGFPDWYIVSGSGRLFDWYNVDTVTELAFLDEFDRDVRLAVSDRDRRVIRAGFADCRESLNLATVRGLFRRDYGSDTFGHSEWHVATW